MSITYCHNCSKYIDEDFDVEHFDVCGKEEISNLEDVWVGEVRILKHLGMWSRARCALFILVYGGYTINYKTRKVEKI